MCIYCKRCFIFLCMNGQLCQLRLLNSILFTSNELQGLIISALRENLACIVHAENTYFVNIVYASRYPGDGAGGRTFVTNLLCTIFWCVKQSLLFTFLSIFCHLCISIFLINFKAFSSNSKVKTIFGVLLNVIQSSVSISWWSWYCSGFEPLYFGTDMSSHYFSFCFISFNRNFMVSFYRTHILLPLPLCVL